jgi:hypothetical protein
MPAAGEYEFSIRDFFFGGAGYITKIDQPHHVILTIDTNRVFDRSFGGSEDLQAVDQHQAIAADEMQSRFNRRCWLSQRALQAKVRHSGTHDVRASRRTRWISTHQGADLPARRRQQRTDR